jgi:hypothetical protein
MVHGDENIKEKVWIVISVEDANLVTVFSTYCNIPEIQ